MKKEPILYGIIGLLIGVIIAGAVFVYSANSGNNSMMNMMGINNQSRNNIDQRFIEQMIPHHESAIAMASLVPQKSNRTELKNLANNIITTQTTEIDKMKQWYKNWYGTEVAAMPASMMSGMMSSQDSVDDLNSASDFDKAFLSQMIEHHEMAVMMANMLATSTNRSEMKGLANSIISAQTKEIEDMKSWQQQWGYATSSSSEDMMNMMHSGH